MTTHEVNTRYHIDYETYSEADLETVGAYRYGLHPSTEILLLAIATDTEGPYLYINPKYGTPDPRALRLLRACSQDPTAELWAHFAGFEIAITTALWDTLKTGVPMPALTRWRCTAALCRIAGLPDKLETACDLLELPQRKDPAGKALIKLLCVPQADGTRIVPAKKPLEWQALGRYCLQDVRSELCLHQRLRAFTPTGALLDIWKFDIRMNHRGIPLNVAAVRKARAIAREATIDLTFRFRKLTGLNPTQREKVKALLETLGVRVPNMKARTLENVTPKLPEGKARQILTLYALVRFAAVKKLDAMLACACPDQRVRGTLLFYGAGTGRWAGRLMQPHNLRKPTIKGTDTAYQMICAGTTRDDLDLLWGNALEVVASCIRNLVQWPEGNMLDADYNAIEARIACWLADQHDVLDDFRKGVDQYIRMAELIYRRRGIKKGSEERELGKRAFLGCGFQMGAEKFQKTCAEQYNIHISLELAQRGVDAYRELCYKVKQLWYALDNAARSAIQSPGTVFRAGSKLSLWCQTVAGIPYLFMRLPSGRKLAYPWPKLEQTSAKDRRPTITYYGEIENGHWGRVKLYGGKLLENADQATAFDYMGHGAIQAERAGFPVILLVHDQSLALHAEPKTHPVTKYVEALTASPAWAEGLPIVAEGKIVPYYRK